MLATLIWHGCLYTCVAGVAVSEGSQDRPLRLRSKSFDIDYRVAQDSLPLQSVVLWYTRDRGRTWRRFGTDPDRRSPFTFRSAEEGLYGFFLVLTNGTGPSSMNPTPSTAPHLWAFVDYTPPVVQIHPPRQTTGLGRRILQIRWSAVDAHLTARPIELEYSSPPDPAWHPVTSDPLTNTGRFDWTLPDDVSGPVVIRITVSDRGGHRVGRQTSVVELAAAPRLRHQPGQSAATAPAIRPVGAADTSLGTIANLSEQRARRLFDQAMAHRDRGLYRQAISRLREAVRLKPQWPQAFVEMADMLYRVGDHDRALEAYELALRLKPTLRPALRGTAVVYRQRNDLAAAAKALSTILLSDPTDAKVWMDLGDVAVFQGDELLARECYTRAARIDPAAAEVIAAAQKRLDLMTTASRIYRPEGS
ncbi:MAG: tetratricopeptide repeat protein [Phycisphaerae bacterium]